MHMHSSAAQHCLSLVFSNSTYYYSMNMHSIRTDLVVLGQWMIIIQYACRGDAERRGCRMYRGVLPFRGTVVLNAEY